MTYSAPLAQLLIWTGIVLCITQSAVFSGLNLAIFSLSKLRLEVEAASGNLDAIGVLDLRKDSNFTLSTIVWGNVVTNVLLTLLSDSVLAGLGAVIVAGLVVVGVLVSREGPPTTNRAENGTVEHPTPAAPADVPVPHHVVGRGSHEAEPLLALL